MCGIAGILHRGGGPVSPDLLLRMTRMQAHRGPDDEGLHIDPSGSVGLGHRRLSVIDLSPAGHQPMSYGGRYWITYNGEIFNYLEIRKELEQRGYRFTTRTDTEVILASYAYWGENCLSHFNGMWAFAIWDTQERRLFCARDRWGIKPFYYVESGGYFAFASEIKALLCFMRAMDLPVRPDEQTVALYLWGLALDGYEETFYSRIKRLLPGHLLEWTEGQVSLRRWYRLEPKQEYCYPTFNAAAEAWGTIFMDSVRLRLRSDVSVGSCLSGGLDSSAIVCVMADLLAQGEEKARLCTFSACYEGHPEIDERRYIDAVIGQTCAEGHQTFPSVEELIKDLDAFLSHQDEPVGSSSQYAQYCVFRLARKEGITVMLDGQGADETLTGYHGAFERHLVGLLSHGRLREAFQLVSVMADRYNYLPFHQWRKALVSLGGWFLPSVGKRARAIQRRPGLWRIVPRPTNSTDSVFHLWEKQSLLHAYLYRITVGSSLQSLLRYEDRNSMAFSIEARLPFLDYRLVELAFNLPAEWLLWGFRTKGPLRAAMKGCIPDVVLERTDKIGFSTPEHEWLRDLSSKILAGLLDRPLPAWEWVDRSKVVALVNHVRSLSPAYSRDRGMRFWRDVNPLWRVLNIAKWSSQFA